MIRPVLPCFKLIPLNLKHSGRSLWRVRNHPVSGKDIAKYANGNQYIWVEALADHDLSEDWSGGN